MIMHGQIFFLQGTFKFVEGLFKREKEGSLKQQG